MALLELKCLVIPVEANQKAQAIVEMVNENSGLFLAETVGNRVNESDNLVRWVFLLDHDIDG